MPRSSPACIGALGQWIGGFFRRRTPRVGEFTYHHLAPLGLLLWLVLLTTPVELFLFELLIPAHLGWLKLLLLVAGIYTVIWVLALYASMTTRPHIVGQEALELNYGLLFNARLRYDEIASIEQRKGKPPGRGGGLKVDKAGRQAYLSVGTDTNLYVRLARPRSFATLFKVSPEVEGIGFFVDDPAAMLSALRKLNES